MTWRTWLRRFFGLPPRTLKQSCQEHERAMRVLEEEVEQTTTTLTSGRWKNKAALKATEVKVHHAGGR